MKLFLWLAVMSAFSTVSAAHEKVESASDQRKLSQMGNYYPGGSYYGNHMGFYGPGYYPGYYPGGGWQGGYYPQYPYYPPPYYPRPQPPSPPTPSRPVYTIEQCEAAGGVVVGDPGDGRTTRPDYVCESSGMPPLGTIDFASSGFIEGGACCGSGGGGSGWWNPWNPWNPYPPYYPPHFPRPPTPSPPGDGTSSCAWPKIYNSCGSACAPTCAVPNPVQCTLQCVEGCFCPQGWVLDEASDACVHFSQCPMHRRD